MRGALASRIFGFLIIAAGRVWGQSITLQIKPHVGDTLRMRLDQQSEMTGVRRTNTGEASAIVVTSMKMFSRAIVESGSEKGTTVLTITDSVLCSGRRMSVNGLTPRGPRRRCAASASAFASRRTARLV